MPSPTLLQLLRLPFLQASWACPSPEVAYAVHGRWKRYREKFVLAPSRGASRIGEADILQGNTDNEKTSFEKSQPQTSLGPAKEFCANAGPNLRPVPRRRRESFNPLAMAQVDIRSRTELVRFVPLADIGACLDISARRANWHQDRAAQRSQPPATSPNCWRACCRPRGSSLPIGPRMHPRL